MGIRIVDHESLGKVFLNTETGEYFQYFMPKNKYFTYNNKSVPFFDGFIDFIQSDIEMAVVPCVCTDSGKRKKRWWFDVIDINNHPFKFFNIELLDGRWQQNNIANLIKGKPYFLLLTKHNEAVNDCRLLSTMLIKKGMN